jgi:GTP-binding protein HflX
VDASSPEAKRQIDTVDATLAEIGAADIPQIMVYNKSDLLKYDLTNVAGEGGDAVFVSAHTGTGLEGLIERIARAAAQIDTTITVSIPFSRGDLVSLAHKRCQVLSEAYTEIGTQIKLRVPPEYLHDFKNYEI